MNSERAIAILTSGKSRGSNFAAIHQWFQDKKLPVKIRFLTVSNLQAPVIIKCLELGIEHFHISLKDMTAFEKKLLFYLRQYDIELLALAGFLKKLSTAFLRNCRIPVLNIHPALLPKFGGKGMYGSFVHQAVFTAGERESGATVHLVNEDYDEGKIVMQQKTSIADCLSPEEIAERVLKIEHEIYARAIWKILTENDSFS
jgi:phosphoribosylglycinamide formyltransferase-1